MIKTRKLTNKTCLKLAAVLLFPASLFGGAVLSRHADKAMAEVSYTYSTGHYDDTSYNVENPSFKNGSKPFESGNTLSGWTAIETESTATGMIIDVGAKVESDQEGVENTTFSENKDSYLLDTNPETKDKNDTRILMINSKADSKESKISKKKGYKSSNVTLDANSYFVFSLSAKTMLNGDDFVEASVYLSGLKDKDGKALNLGYEKISPNSWTDYYFFIATGDVAQTVNLEFYLGSRNTESQGVALFDNSQITRYSENEFYDLCLSHGYKGNDSFDIAEGKKVFLIEKLASEKEVVEETKTMNFDFEDSSASVEDNWTFLAQPNGQAKIINYADFAEKTGYSPIGNDLQYQNEQGLVMWTNSSEYSSYVGLRSKDIKIMPHSTYKVSLKLKIAGMEKGTFYLKVTENDYIYEVYPNEVSDDEENSKYYALQSGKTSGYNSNKTDAWTNDYQTVEYYVKGHPLYASSINLELWLGDSSANAVGCVVVDDIVVEEVLDSQMDSSKSLSLTTLSSVSENITNASFNTVTAESENYPLNASSWTATKGDDDNCESGVIYLGNDEVYDEMYSSYDWAGINPKNSDGSDSPANVYMMFNRTNTYQALKSPSFTLSGNEYYKLSFDFYTQLFKSLNTAEIKVEVVDNKGIVLFSQDGISSNDEWSKMDIYFRTTSSKSHSVNLNIYFGDSENTVGGMVYLDNFAFESSNADVFEKALYKTDMTGFYTHLDLEKTDAYQVVENSAYTFEAKSYNSSDENCAFGGIVNGKDNAYGIVNDKDNFLALTTMEASKASLTSKFTLDFAANSYYKLTFSLATLFNDSALAAANDEHDCKYGVTIKLDGYKEIASLVTDGTLKEYTIYFKTGDSATTPTLQFILDSDCEATTGSALLTNLALEQSNSDVYAYVQTQGMYNESVFTSEVKAAEDEDKETENPEEKPETPETPAESVNPWILASSLITGIAIIVAVAALAFRKIKIKKIDKIKNEAYDRRINKNHDIVMAEAQKARDEEVKNLQLAKQTLENEKADLEEKHREYIRIQREKDNGKLSKEVEKAFKQHSAKISTINEKINILKEKINYAVSAEHLIEVERKIIAEKDKTKKSK